MAAPTVNAKLLDEVSNLKSDMAKVGALVDRLDITIDKLTEVSTSVSQLLAVHETKITSQDIVLKQTVDLVEKRRVETEEKLQNIHDRISENETKFVEKLDKQHKEILEELRRMQDSSSQQHKAIGARMSKVEKWMWLLIGGAGVVGFLLDKVELAKFFVK
jgi:chromosome segregation ATPase